MKNLVVAGIPRCGTTYLFRSLMGLPQGSGSPKGRHLKKLPGVKCHSLAPRDRFLSDPWASQVDFCLRENAGRAIFVFGDPFAAVISTIRTRFDPVHAANCGCLTPLDKVDLLEGDFFNYEKMFDSWMTHTHRYPVIAVRYETMYRYHHLIDAFVGYRVPWNPWLARNTKIGDVEARIYSKLLRVYHGLRKKVQEAPDFQIL